MRAIIFLLPGLLFLTTVSAQGFIGCQYLHDCTNNASCARREDGVEYCMCPPKEFTGPICEWEFALCDDRPTVCKNGGTCYDEGGIRICVCPPGFSGDFCEYREESSVCPTPGEDDMVFLPTCTLKTTLTKLAKCINDQLPFLRRFSPNDTMCHEKVTKVKHCFYHTIGDCSGVKCEGAYWYGGVRLYINIAEQFYNPISNFSVALHQILCTSPGPNGTYSYPDAPFNIGEPVCRGNLVDRLVEILRTTFPVFDQPGLCQHLETLKMDIYNEVNESCDWSKIFDALPYLRMASINRTKYWEDALVMAQEYFKEWFVHGCGDGSGTGECPTITSSTPQCKIADIWMCHYFSYKKAFSQWTAKFMEWWDGCFSYDERNWDDWASSLGMNRGDGHGMGDFGMTGGHGKDGFKRMIKANTQCSDLDHEDCKGDMFTTTMGCTICYRAGRPRNPQRMFATWMQEYQQYQLAMRFVAKLREECAGTTMGCEDDFSSTMAPPTFPVTGWPDMSSTMPSTTGWPDMPSTMSSDWGSSATPTGP